MHNKCICSRNMQCKTQQNLLTYHQLNHLQKGKCREFYANERRGCDTHNIIKISLLVAGCCCINKIMVTIRTSLANGSRMEKS